MSAAQEWITDRLPTAADADKDGDVKVQDRPKAEPSAFGPYFHWSMVRPGMAWTHADSCEAPTKPALVVGQRWRRRDGEVVTISEHDVQNETDFPFCAGDHWYRADGTSYIDDSDAELVELIELAAEPELIEPAAEPEPVTTPRRFVLIGRTIWLDQGGSQCHIIDAIADDGTAWWMWLDETEWQQLPALPARTSDD